MGAHNPYQHHANDAAFVATLKRDDAEAWETMLAYVRIEVKLMLRLRPAAQDREDAIDSYTSDVIWLIFERLEQFDQRGPFSAWVDQIVRRALFDTNLKNALQAVERFLAAANKLDQNSQTALRTIIEGIEWPERNLLYAAIGAAERVVPAGHPRMWYSARYRLLTNPQFQQLLHTLACAGLRQATTLLHWHTAWKGEIALSDLMTSDINGEHREYVLVDPSPPPLDALVRQINDFAILECLEQLRHVSPQQAQAIERKFWGREPDEHSARVLDQARPATFRQWLRRGLNNLQKCLSSKSRD